MLLMSPKFWGSPFVVCRPFGARRLWRRMGLKALCGTMGDETSAKCEGVGCFQNKRGTLSDASFIGINDSLTC